MRKRTSIPIQLDDQGHLILPEEVLNQYRLVPGSTTRLETSEQGILISRSSSSPAMVYVEPTNACNLDCSTCMRNVWEEPPGWMAWQTYEHILDALGTITPAPGLFFGGMGEPLAHPKIREMVSAACQAGVEVELITNGILLDEQTLAWMMACGLKRLWVSIDGATPESYADVRLGDALPLVINNLNRLQALRALSGARAPKLGIAFVAMRRNIADLPEVIRLGKRLGADQFSITNVLPYTYELSSELLYTLSMYNNNLQPTRWSPQIALPRMDKHKMIIENLARVVRENNIVQVSRQDLKLGINTCPFVEKGSLSIRWDGEVSPCIPLLHTHSSFLEQKAAHFLCLLDRKYSGAEPAGIME